MTATRPRLRLNFWMTVCAVPALGLLIGLGVWQLHRLQWKEALIADRAARLAKPAIALSQVPATGWRSFELRHVMARGHFLYAKTMEVVGRNYRGQTGVHIVTPLVLADGTGTLLVNRGWAPPKDERHPGEFRRPRGDIDVTGVLRAAGRINPWAPDNEPGKGIWFFPDPPAMAKAAGLTDAKPFLIEAVRRPGDESYPIGGQTVTKIRNEHLQYAITWFSLGAVLVVIFVLYHVKKAKAGPDEA